MARYGALTALQAALLGISGGAQGLVQAREREQKEGERRKQFEREELRDQREIARDEAERNYREAQMRQQAELAGKEIASREKVAGMQVSSAASERALRQQELDTKRKELLDEATGWWNQTMIPTAGEPVTPERQAAATRAKRTFDRMRAADKQRPAEELIAAAYAAEQAFQLAESRRASAAASMATAESKPKFNPQPVSPQTAPPFNPGAVTGQTQRKPFMERAMELKAQPGMTPAKAKAQMASEGYDVINMR